MKKISTLKTWGKFYRYMGFAVVPVGKEGDRKRPFVKEWKKWSNQTQTKEEFENLPFPSEATGIGGITGANDVIGIDIDNFGNVEFINELSAALELPPNYEWCVLSGSERGGHIWVECNAHEAFKDLVEKEKNVYTITSHDKSIFDHIEVRVKQHTVLPPSLHPSDKRYKFINCQQPLSEPMKISPQKLREVLLGLGELKTRKINSQNSQIGTNGNNGNGHHSKLVDIVNDRFELVDFAKDFLPDGHIQTRESNGEIRVGKRGEGYGTILISKDGKTWNHPQSDWTGGGWPQIVAYHLTNDVAGYRKEDFGKYLNFAAKWVGLSESEIKDIKRQEAKAYYEANPHLQKRLAKQALGDTKVNGNGQIIDKGRYIFEVEDCVEDWPFCYKQEFKSKGPEVRVNEPDFNDWLHHVLGIGLYKIGDSYIYIRVDGNIVKRISRPEIKSMVDEMVKMYPPVRTLIRKTKSLLSSEGLEFLPDITEKVKPRRDDKNSCILYYQNGAIHICKEGFTFMEYDTIDWYIWENEIIDREIPVNIPKLNKKAPYYRFSYLVSNKEERRLKSLMIGNGYMMHSYKDPANAKVYFLCDELAKKDEPNGGSGKGLIAQGIRQIVPTVMENAMRMRRDQFMYQKVTTDTKVFCFDEITDSFNFRELFSDITDGITVERKGFTAETIPAKDAPKFIMLSNDRIKMDGGSFKRRLFKIELSDYFHHGYSPFDEFKHTFFSDWDKEQWIAFDVFMLNCSLEYFKNDCKLETIENKSSAEIQIEYDTDPEFVLMANELKPNKEYDKKDFHKEFIANTNKIKITSNRLSRWMKRFAEYKGYEYESKMRDDGKGRLFILKQGEEDIDKLGYNNEYGTPF